MALIVVTSVMTGLQRDLREKILGTNPHIWLYTYGETLRIDDWPHVLARSGHAPGVVAAAPVRAHRGRAAQRRRLRRGRDPARHRAGARRARR
jgi:ABC-type lipoprotein release transport system permease subunit